MPDEPTNDERPALSRGVERFKRVMFWLFQYGWFVLIPVVLIVGGLALLPWKTVLLIGMIYAFLILLGPFVVGGVVALDGSRRARGRDRDRDRD